MDGLSGATEVRGSEARAGLTQGDAPWNPCIAPKGTPQASAPWFMGARVTEG
jgi:hypothetical protein